MITQHAALGQKRLLGSDNLVANLIVFRVGDNAAANQIVGGGEGALGNDAVGFTVTDSGKAQKVFTGGFVDIDSFVVGAHALAHSFDHGFGIAAHGFGGFGGALADLVGIVTMIGAGAENGQAHESGNTDEERAGEVHETQMPGQGWRLENDAAICKYCGAISTSATHKNGEPKLPK